MSPSAAQTTGCDAEGAGVVGGGDTGGAGGGSEGTCAGEQAAPQINSNKSKINTVNRDLCKLLKCILL